MPETTPTCTCDEETKHFPVHFCPYQAEINDNDEDFCDCCESCTDDCAMDI